MEESSYSGKNNNNNYCHGNSSRSSRSISVSNIDGGLIRKGPWKQEEDQVLLNHVKKYGPRDWSSIRSKGLLHRTGKSCRLRWVNKLRPNLKTGCKFTAEEERVVIELQSELGNKWATIATHLAGRTDNDVKNFWSSRQKRLARLLQQSQSPQSHKRRKSSTTTTTTTDSTATKYCSYFIEVPKSSQSSSSSSHIGSTSTNTMQIITVPETKNPECLASEANRDFSVCPIPLNEYPCSNELQLDEKPFSSIPPLQSYLPLPPETQELIDRVNCSFLQTFGCADYPILADDGLQLLSYCGGEMRGQTGEKSTTDDPVTPDSFFDDFPSDMFEIGPLPSPSRW